MASNLNWVTAKENIHHAITTGLRPRATHRILSESEVVAIKRLLADGRPGTSIARLFDVSNGCICGIKGGSNWKHVTI